MALLRAAAAPCQLIVCRTFAELQDRPDFLEEARRSRSLSDSFAVLHRSGAIDDADCEGKLIDLVDAETDVDSRCSMVSSQQAVESDVEGPGGFQCHPQAPAACWVPMMSSAAAPAHAQFAARAEPRRAEACQRILARPVKPTPNVQNNVHKTTVMLRNMPNNYTRALLLELLDREGFACQYDLVYLPIDFESRACKGYAFINLRDSDTALRFFQTFEGYSSWAMPSRKVSGVSWSGTQGLQTHIDRYRNSSMMSASTPDEYKPAIFANGVRMPFPAPTGRVARSSGAARA